MLLFLQRFNKGSEMLRKILLMIAICSMTSHAQSGSWGRGMATSGGAFTGSILFADGTVAAPSLTFSSEQNSGLFWTNSTVDYWSATVAGSEIARFRNAGTAATTQFIISPEATLGAQATPSLAFGDGNTGFYEQSDNQLRLTLGGTPTIRFLSNQFDAGAGGAFTITFAEASATVPVFTFNGDTDTGVGRATTDAVSVVAGGVEGIRITEATRIDVAVNGAVNYAADGQANDDYEVAIPAITALVAGLTVTFLANTANTGGATLEITSVGDLDAILKQHDVVLADNDIEAGQIVVVVFDGTNWQMVSQIAN